ncbi:MAG: tRNA (adenosine(37)-N6)-threonylcarbamoyltransferase complex dimerization subunit type 1 TsaB [Sandaracinaceae bacterium]
MPGLPRVLVRVLAFDTSTPIASVAVLVGEELAAEVGGRVASRHGESLFPMIEQALAWSGIGRSDLDLIAVGLGPGSFTGTRIGVATAKGLALALERPIVGVVTLRALAAAAPASRIATIVDAHQGEVFVAAYRREAAASICELAPDHLRPDEAAARVRALGPIARLGSGLRRYPDVFAALDGPTLPAVYDAPRAAHIARLAQERHAQSGPDELALVEPLYVRASDAKLPG